MKKQVYLCLLAALCVVANSCSTMKPAASHVSTPDYNKRITVNNPHYVKRPTPVGYGFGVALPLAGAAGGAASGLIKGQDSDGRPVGSAVGGGLIGLLAGSAVAYFTTWRTHNDNNEIYVSNYDVWAKRAGGDYIYLDGSGSSHRFIDRAAERGYMVQNLADVRDFCQAFPNSREANDVFDQALRNLRRDDMRHLVTLLPNCRNVEQAKTRYVVESRTYADLCEAQKLYPQPEASVEAYFVKQICSADDALDFKRRYPRSTYDRVAVRNAFRSDNEVNTVSKVKQLKSAYGSAFDLTSTDLTSDYQVPCRNYYNAVIFMQGNVSESQLDRLNEQYRWLKYENKNQDVMRHYWLCFDRSYSSGTSILRAMDRLPHRNFASAVGLTSSVVAKFVGDQYYKIMRETVSTKAVNYLTSSSPDFEQWVKSSYTANYVSSSEAFRSLIYGEVENSSKFDIMLALSVNGTLVVHTQTESSGLLGFASTLAKMFGLGQAPTQDIQVGEMKDYGQFIVKVPARGTAPYAFYVDLKDTELSKYRDGGLNIDYIGKVSSHMLWSGLSLNIRLSDKAPDANQVEKQKNELAMVQTGLPSARLTEGLFNRSEFNQADWDERYRRVLEEARRNPSPSYSSSSSSSSSSTSSSSSDEEDDEYACTIHLVDKEGRNLDHKKVYVSGSSFWSTFDRSGRTDEKGRFRVTWSGRESIDVDIRVDEADVFIIWQDVVKNYTLTNGRTYDIVDPN